MNTWKVIVEHNLQTIEFIIEAGSFSEAYILAEKEYPSGKIISIKPLEEKK